MNSEKLRPIVMTKLKALASKLGLKPSKDGYWIRCPYHKHGKERTPSLKVNIARHGKFKVGDFFCFSCRKFGNWNELSEVLRLGKTYDLSFDTDIDDELLSDDDVILFSNAMFKSDNLISEPWPESMDWRGISGKLLSDMKSRLVYSDVIFANQLQLIATVGGEEKGFINCLLKKDYPKQKAYFNSPGEWASKYLFPFDYSKMVCEKFDNRVLFLTEGPRDALTLLQHNIPACAILGTGNWNELKADYALSINPIAIITAFDNDEPGIDTTKKAFLFLKTKIPVFRIRWPEGVKDPAVLPPEYFKYLKKKVKLLNSGKIKGS